MRRNDAAKAEGRTVLADRDDALLELPSVPASGGERLEDLDRLAAVDLCGGRVSARARPRYEARTHSAVRVKLGKAGGSLPARHELPEVDNVLAGP